MRTFKLLLLLVLFTSCGYNIKSDNQIKRYEYNYNGIVEELEQIKQDNHKFELRLLKRIKIDSLKLITFKDSVEFMKLNKIGCWEKQSHRHSCEIYK